LTGQAIIKLFHDIGRRLICFFVAASLCSIAAAQQNAVETLSFASNALAQTETFTVVRPDHPPGPEGYPVLIILHGLGRNQKTLLEQPETRELMLHQKALIILPDSGRGWWIDSPAEGAKYDSMLMEVVAEVRRRFPVSAKKDEWGVLGWSMGGFGAVHFAERHPEVVNFVGSIIGLLDYPRADGLPEDQRFPIDTSVFGDDPPGWARENPSLHVRLLHGKDIVVVIGTAAFDRTMNENFVRSAASAGIPVEVQRIQGAHVFTTVASGLSILLPRAQAHFAQAMK
jgi:S-formylglutathione hydrolase FrmB